MIFHSKICLNHLLVTDIDRIFKFYTYDAEHFNKHLNIQFLSDCPALLVVEFSHLGCFESNFCGILKLNILCKATSNSFCISFKC